MTTYDPNARFRQRVELARSHFEREINEKMIYPLSLQPVYDLMRACASSQASGVEDCGNAQLPSADEGSKPVLFARLPRMTDPLGRHWRQPKGLRERVEIYETHATIQESDWQALPRYDSSLPSGVYAGKAWRRGPCLLWYGRPHMVPGIHGKLEEVCSVGRARALVTP